MTNIKLTLNLHNRTRQSINPQTLRARAQEILHQQSLRGIVELDVTLSGQDYIRQLNRRFRHMDRPTDVLSFPVSSFHRGHPQSTIAQLNSADLPVHLGDIIICYQIAALQARQNNHTIEQEIMALFEHGLKHLLGFHHR